ncbi:MAG TPA: nuclear transport factor 2 family protein [Steroidobacteraceae bacterium]|nr:nuclear transport factor 2 family protein [Steroidobacteraceae bacterium]
MADQSKKDAAIEFLRLASRGDVEQAFDRYVAGGFRHHNPWFAGDAGSLMRAMADNAREFPAKSCEPLRTVVEGDLVCVHSRIRLAPGDRSLAVVHIFRFDGERIVELWDVGQQEPEEMPNEHGMF